MVYDWIQLVVGVLLILAGLFILLVELYGVFRMKYVLNRMHAAAIGDTLGISVTLYGLIVINGFSMTSLKLLLVVIFLWFSAPVSSHLVARLEVTALKEKGQFEELEPRLLSKEKKE